jgi:Xaa-Pro aminopeptidase
MEVAGLDAMFVMKPANLAYFTGDGRPCALALFTREPRCIVAVPTSDLRSAQATSVASELWGVASEEDMFHGFRDVLRAHRLERATIGLEKNFFDAALYDVFTAHILPHATVAPAGPVISRLRMIKEAGEIACLRAAAHVADIGMAAAVKAVGPGVGELDVAAEAEYAMRKAGAEGYASATYVASGWRSAMAHGPASVKTIGPGEAVQVHLAPIASGYTADLCRTMLVDPVSPEARRALAAYVAAQAAAIDAATPGAPLLGIDAALSEVLERAGFGGAFLRPTFHGVGLEHEEAPIPGGHAVIHGEERVEHVQAGMVLAVGNCGIYRESFGVRAEDTVWISDDGAARLTRYPARPRLD